MSGGYFDPLADVASAEAIAAAHRAAVKAIHSENDRDEPAMLAGARALLEVTKQEIAAEYHRHWSSLLKAERESCDARLRHFQEMAQQ